VYSLSSYQWLHVWAIQLRVGQAGNTGESASGFIKDAHLAAAGASKTTKRFTSQTDGVETKMSARKLTPDARTRTLIQATGTV